MRKKDLWEKVLTLNPALELIQQSDKSDNIKGRTSETGISAEQLFQQIAASINLPISKQPSRLFAYFPSFTERKAETTLEK